MFFFWIFKCGIYNYIIIEKISLYLMWHLPIIDFRCGSCDDYNCVSTS